MSSAQAPLPASNRSVLPKGPAARPRPRSKGVPAYVSRMMAISWRGVGGASQRTWLGLGLGSGLGLGLGLGLGWARTENG